MATQINAVMEVRPVGRTDGTGVDHQLRLIWKPNEDTEKEFIIKTVIIPTDEMNRLVPLNTSQRGELYKELILTYLPYLPISEPSPVEPVFSVIENLTLVDLESWIVEYNGWEEEKSEFDAQRLQEVEAATFIGNAAANWIESLGNFESWPYSFTLQIGG